MAKHRVKQEKLLRIRLGSRYFGFELGQFYWECLKLEAASEELSETDILRRIIRSWSQTLPASIQEKARAEADSVEAWKAQQLRAREDARLQAKQGQVRYTSSHIRGKEPPKPRGPFLRRQSIEASN